MISYVPCHVTDLEEVRSEIFNLCNLQFDVDKEVFRKIEIDHALLLPKLAENLDRFGMTDHIAMIYVNNLKNRRTHIHIDVSEEDDLGFNLLIPVRNYQNTYRNYFTIREGAPEFPMENLVHGEQGTPIKDIRFNKEDATLDFRIHTTYPTIHNTRYAHNFESFTGDLRLMFVVMLRKTWELKPEHYDISISP